MTFAWGATITPPKISGPLIASGRVDEFIYYDCPWNTYLNTTNIYYAPPSTNIVAGLPATAVNLGTNHYDFRVNTGTWPEANGLPTLDIALTVVALPPPGNDTNGVPYQWYFNNGLSSGQQDPDRDGLLNYQEYLYGTKPAVSEGFAIWTLLQTGTTSIP